MNKKVTKHSQTTFQKKNSLQQRLQFCLRWFTHKNKQQENKLFVCQRNTFFSSAYRNRNYARITIDNTNFTPKLSTKTVTAVKQQKNELAEYLHDRSKPCEGERNKHSI